VSTAVPCAVVKVVSSTRVSSTYRRLTWNSPAGRIVKCPPAGSRRRQNTDGPSKRGKQSQSTEPSRLTSAAERQSESSAYSPIGKLSITVSSPATRRK
jgi:hypothetical protein